MIVYFDLETGGLTECHPDIQLAAVAMDGDRELGTFERKIRFDIRAADPDALQMNHFRLEVWLREAYEESLVAREFAEFLSDYKAIEMISKRSGRAYSVVRLAGYNAASFDGPRLQRMFRRHDVFLPAHPQVMCVMQRALWWFQETGFRPESMKLGDVCEFFGVPLEGAHDALADVRATARLACALKERALAKEAS